MSDASRVAAALGAVPGVGHDGDFRERADYHGVWPLVAGGAEALRDAAAVELLRRRELLEVLRALDDAGVAPLLLKGTALAYSIYPSPVLRPRADTDLLIPDDDRERLEGALLALGYHKPPTISGSLVRYQCGYGREDRFGVEHVLDVHWRVSNTQLFAGALDYEDLAARAVEIPGLGEHARGLCLADALLLACMHRAHHMHAPYYVDGVPRRGGDRLIWLYDLHLLVEAMSPGELMTFAESADKTGMRTICRDGLMRARACFGTRIPDEVATALTGAPEASAAHLEGGGARYFMTELRSLPSWRERLALMGEHLFPPAEYMLGKYGVARRGWLPMLYLHRGIHGAWKRILDR